MQVMVRTQTRTALTRVLTLMVLYVLCVVISVVTASILGFAAALIAWGAKHGWTIGWLLVGG